MNGNVLREPCPYFRETQDKVRNNDMRALEPHRFVKRARCGHRVHPSNTDLTVLNPLKCGGDVSICEISDIWRT